MPRKKNQKAKILARQVSAPELKTEKSRKKKKTSPVTSPKDIDKYDYDADQETSKKSNSRPTSPLPFFMPILEYGFSWPRRKSPFRSSSSENSKNVVSPVSSPDSGFPGSPCQVVPSEEINGVDTGNTDSSGGILSSDTDVSDKESTELDNVIASLDNIIEQEETDEEVDESEVNNSQFREENSNEILLADDTSFQRGVKDDIIFEEEEDQIDINGNQQSVSYKRCKVEEHYEQELEKGTFLRHPSNEAFSIKNFKVKDLILDFEKRNSGDDNVFMNEENEKESLLSSTEELEELQTVSKPDLKQKRLCVKSLSTTSLVNQSDNSHPELTKSNSANSLRPLSPIIKDGKGSHSGKKVRFMIDPQMKKSISCDVLGTPDKGEFHEWEVTVKEIDIPHKTTDGDEKINCPVRNSFEIKVRFE